MRKAIYSKGKEFVLNTYASGSGAFNFSWSVNKHPYPSASIDVTMKDARRLINLKDNKYLLTDHTLIKRTWPKTHLRAGSYEILLVPNVARVNETTLAYKGTDYTYEVEKREDGTVVRPSAQYFHEYAYPGGEPQRMELKNWGIKGALNFFLDKEDYIYAKLKNKK